MEVIKEASKWDIRFLELAKHVSEWSYDPSTKVGAVIAQNKFVVGIGFNGFPQGINDDIERYNDRELKYKMIVHAEVNALIMAGKEKCKGSTLYVYPTFSIPPVCQDCCKTLIQYGIKEIVGYYPSREDEDRAERWKASIQLSRFMCDEVGIDYRGVSR
jgi:dCMP deaminase